jgi:hypothetical protein
MNKKFSLLIFTVLMVGVLMVGVAAASNEPENGEPDSFAHVGWRLNCFLPAFKDTDGVSIPFKTTSIRPPLGYRGDFYVDEFTDAKIKHSWQELKMKDPAAAQKILAGLSVNTDETAPGRFRITGWLDTKGPVNGNDVLKLIDIRRPAFFGQVPYFEDIGKLEKDTYTVEFTVPSGPYERFQLKQSVPIKLRGWFVKGKGVSTAKGKRTHALVILIQGYGGQMFATQHPDAPCYDYSFKTKKYEGIPYPDKNLCSEQWGPRQFREYFYSFNQAGFDLLIVDKRGHGISGSVNSLDNSEMAEDIFRMMDQLESGEGLTVLAPTGQLLQGKKTAGLLLRGRSAKQVPMVIGGFSQGAQITCFAMQKNFVGWTAFNEPGQKVSPAKNYNIKAAILLGDFAGGIGYWSNPDLGDVYSEAARRVEKYTMFQPTSEILANIDKWPAVFFGKGLWDKFQSAEGTYEAYCRNKGLKELVFLRCEHVVFTGGAKIHAHLINKMTEFAVRAIVNPGKKYSELKSFKKAVLSSPSFWDPSSRP